jgi:hypothetical protein
MSSTALSGSSLISPTFFQSLLNSALQEKNLRADEASDRLIRELIGCGSVEDAVALFQQRSDESRRRVGKVMMTSLNRILYLYDMPLGSSGGSLVINILLDLTWRRGDWKEGFRQE